MRPENGFGIQGHTKYVFLHEAEENSYEMSILAPAQSGSFDQILDIPVRSIRAVTIITDEYSQVAAEIGLEFRMGKGHEFFLDSERIELNSIYLTFQPENMEDFKEELISKCPGLKVVQTDKEAALKLTSSDKQKPPSQVSVSEDFMDDTADGKQKLNQPSPKTSREQRLRKDSIHEIQAEQDNAERIMDDEDELQNLVDAIIPDARNEKGDETAPQATKELSKITPASKESGSKSRAPPKGSNGVKPKAKPPIFQRDLQAKPSQPSTQEAIAAPLARTRGKDQTGSLTTTQADPASQGVKSKQKQPVQAGAAQRASASLAKKGSSNGQPKMPPPQDKPNNKTRSTQSSQVTDDIVDSQDSEEPKALPRVTQKTSAHSTKPSTSSSENAPNQLVEANKSTFDVSVTANPSKTSKDPEYQGFSDDFITDDPGLDASTPKVTAAERQARKKTPAASTSNTQTNKSVEFTGTTSQKQKRYSLHPPVKTTPSVTDTYDIPVHDDEDEAPQKAKGKKSANARKSAPKAGISAKPASKTGTKADAKKRQSAPATLGRTAGTRHSQRAAAAKASEQLRGADESDVEHAEVDDQPAQAKSQSPQKGKTHPARDATKTKLASKEAVANKVARATEGDEDILPLPRLDETPPIPVQNDTKDRVGADNIYDTTPKKPSQISSPPELQLVVKNSEELAKVSKVPNKNKRGSALDMASKLGDILGDMGENPPETEPRNSGVGKELEQSAGLKKRRPTKADNEELPTNRKSTKSAGNKSLAVAGESKIPGIDIWDISDSSSPAAELGHVDASPPAPKQPTKSVSQEKSKANDDKIFKKPEIPTHHKKAPIRPDEKEPSTSESRPSELGTDEEPEQDVATSEFTNKVIVEAEQDAPMESTRDCSDTGEIGRKRKTYLAATTTPKRQRVDEIQDRPKELSPAASLPSSPPVRASPSPLVREKRTPKQTQKSRKPNENVTSPRRSPRLIDRARQATYSLQQATSDVTSAAKDPDRKPHLVSFGTRGALNQGISSTIKVRKDLHSPNNISKEAAKPARKNRASTKNVPEEASKPAREEVGEKRKRGRLDVVDTESLPNKRQSVSPKESTVMDDYAYEDDDLPAFQDSPLAEAIKAKSTGDRRNTKPPTRPSSQTSRVDKNGSPIASSQEDHFGKLRKRLGEDRNGNKSQVPPSAVFETPVAIQQRRLFEVFGPGVVLEKKSKARNSSPEEAAARYVAHEKTADGVYQEVATREVVAAEKKVHDPFTEKARKSSGFTDRLMSGSSTGKQAGVSKPSEVIVAGERKGQDVEPTFPLHARGASKTNLRPKPARGTQRSDPRERSRVGIENQASDPSMLSEMTMGTSYESQSSESDRAPPKEKPSASAVWNVAIRPHYTNLHEAIHRIADVSTPSQTEKDKTNSYCRKLSSVCKARKM
jgi:hypothetical protein